MSVTNFVRFLMKTWIPPPEVLLSTSFDLYIWWKGYNQIKFSKFSAIWEIVPFEMIMSGSLSYRNELSVRNCNISLDTLTVLVFFCFVFNLIALLQLKPEYFERIRSNAWSLIPSTSRCILPDSWQIIVKMQILCSHRHLIYTWRFNKKYCFNTLWKLVTICVPL